MKTGYNILLTAVFMVCLMSLASCTSMGAGIGPANKLITPQIDLHVVGHPKELKVITLPSPNCQPSAPANHRKGCIRIEKTDTAQVKFMLKTSPDWYFKKIQICNGSTKAGMVCTFDTWQTYEFYATDKNGIIKHWPDTSGVIELTSLPDKQTEFYLHDYNSVPQDYFYTIWVCPSSDPTGCIDTDPPIQNGGRR